MLKRAEEDTRDRPGATVNLAVGYGGRREIADAVRSLLAEHAERGTTLEELVEVLDVDHIAEHLYTRGQPDPDLVIRTSGEQRLSGFLLWQTRALGVLLHRRRTGRTSGGSTSCGRCATTPPGTAASAADGRAPGELGDRATAGSGLSAAQRSAPALAAGSGRRPPASTCGWGCASTGWSPASSTPTPATRGCAPQVEDEPAPTPAAAGRDQARALLRRAGRRPGCRPTGPTTCAAS